MNKVIRVASLHVYKVTRGIGKKVWNRIRERYESL